MKLYHLVVPDDHGGMGHDQVGLVIDEENERALTAVWLMDPDTSQWNLDTAFTVPQMGFTMMGAFMSVEAVADWTRYAVTEPDGTLVYAPEEVFRYARRDPELWQM